MTKEEKEVLKEIQKAVKRGIKQNVSRAECKLVSNSIYKNSMIIL